LSERAGRENSKFQIPNAKLRKPDVVGMAVFIGGRGQRGADGLLGIGFVLHN